MNVEQFRHVPFDVEVEQALLGSIIVDNKALERVDGLIGPEHFYDPLHGRIFTAMIRAVEKGAAVTPLTLHADMKADPGLIEIGGTAYLGGLAQAAPALPNVRDFARILRDLAVRRNLIRIAEEIAHDAYAPPSEKSPQDQIAEAEKALYAVSENSRRGGGAMNFSEALDLAVSDAERAQANGGRISGVTSGFADVDQLLGGLQPSDLLILAGRPGMGKTALGTNMAFHAARAFMADQQTGAPVLFFSLEMAAKQLSARILSERTEIEMWKIRNGKLSPQEWESLVLNKQSLSDMPIYIDDAGGISIAQIAARARRMKREKGIGLIVIDYLQLVEASRRQENRVQEVTEVTKGLKALAKELNVPILALSQLSRGVDNREDKRPLLSDLRESGSIEQDADVVMFVYREEYYLKTRQPDPDDATAHAAWLAKCERFNRRAELLVEKHRHGETRKIDLFFDDRFTRFSNLSAG